MVSSQFNTNTDKQDGAPSNSPGDDTQEIVNEGDASTAQLEEAAAILNAGAEGAQPAPQEPVAPQIPASVQNRMDITNRQAAARREDMVADQGYGPSTDDNPDDVPANPQDLNAQNVYYGQFGDPNANFAGDPLANTPIPAPIPANPEPGVDAGDLVTVKVDGEELQVSQDDLVRSYQKGNAADKRLNDATELLKQAQGVAMAGVQPTATTPADQSEAGQSPTESISEPGLDELDYAGIAEKIQLGETSEGAEALKELVTQVVSKQQDNAPLDSAALVTQVVSEVQDSTLSDQARQTFEQNYPDIVADPQLHRMAQVNAVEVMVEDFVANGANDEMIAHARANPAQAAYAHRTMRKSGEFADLKTPDELYTEAGTRTRSWLSTVSGQPQPGDVPKTENAGNPTPAIPRAQRAQAAQQSPQMRQAPQKPPSQQAPTVKSPKDVIAEMKRGRGQFPAGQRVG